jgi:hypothetical protein
MSTSGWESNNSGKFLEEAIEREFRARGINVFDYTEKHSNTDMFAERFLLKNAPYTSIYGCQSRSEFLYHDDTRYSHIRIECRWQQVAGSVDEKLPYLYMNAVQSMPEKEIWLVLDGGGARSDALDWLKRQCAQLAAKDVRVLTVPEARTRINRLLAECAGTRR